MKNNYIKNKNPCLYLFLGLVLGIPFYFMIPIPKRIPLKAIINLLKL